MKEVILAGGIGSRISEETHLKPKPMIEIGGKPMLWHIMNLFSSHDITDFVIKNRAPNNSVKNKLSYLWHPPIIS